MAAITATLSSAGDWAADNKAAALAIGGTGVLGALYLWKKRHDVPSSFELTGGAVDSSKVKSTVRGAQQGNNTRRGGPGGPRAWLTASAAVGGGWQRRRSAAPTPP